MNNLDKLTQDFLRGIVEASYPEKTAPVKAEVMTILQGMLSARITRVVTEKLAEEDQRILLALLEREETTATEITNCLVALDPNLPQLISQETQNFADENIVRSRS